MRRPAIAGVALGAVLAVMPLASRAATAPSVTLISPSANHATSGDLVVRWSYAGFYRTTPVDVEAAVGTGPFQRLARTAVDDGTRGYFGSYTVSTESLADAGDYTVRLVMPTSRRVTSSVSPVTIDKTGPTSTVTADPVVNGGPAAEVTTDVEGTATDALSAVQSVVVTFTNASGTRTVRNAECECGSPSATWSASTVGLAPGRYTVRAEAVDALGNTGEPGSAELVIVGTPEDPTPAIVATVDGVVETVTTTVGTVVETVTGTTTVDGAVETVTGVVTNPPTFDDTLATVTGTVTDAVGTVTGTIEGTGGGS